MSVNFSFFIDLSDLLLRRISCHGRNYSQPYFFKRNQSSDNRSHGFGAKFLLKKLSASDFSYERKSAFREDSLIDSILLRETFFASWGGGGGGVHKSVSQMLAIVYFFLIDTLLGKRCQQGRTL